MIKKFLMQDINLISMIYISTSSVNTFGTNLICVQLFIHNIIINLQ